MITILANIQAAIAAHVDETHRCIWFSETDGKFCSVPFAGGTVTLHQTMASPATSIAGNGHVLLLAHRNGTVSTLQPNNPAAPIHVIANSNLLFGQAAVTNAKHANAAIVSRPRLFGRLAPMRGRGGSNLAIVNLRTGGLGMIALDELSGVAIAGKTAYVGINRNFPRRGEVAQLKGSATVTLVSGLPLVGHIGVADKGSVLLACHPGAGRLTVARPGTGKVDTVPVSALPGSLIEASGLDDGRVAILTSKVLALIDGVADLVKDPVIAPIAEPVFVGSWVKVEFDLGTSGLTPNDVHFAVPDGLTAGFVSYARENGDGNPVPLLVVGGAVGTHKVELLENSTASVLASADFEITDHWHDADTGPSGTYMTASSFDGGAWGGGPSAPQNMAVHPHTGTWRSLVLMIDTSSRRWPTDVPTMTANRNDILGHVVNGVVFNGDTRSARHYYEENSRFVAASGSNPARGLTLSARNNQAFGPVGLPDAWDSYFEQKKDKDGKVIDQRWSSKGGTVQTIISRAISDGVATTADFTNIDVLIIVPFSADATSGTGARFVWPHAHDAVEFLCGTNAVTDRRSLAYTFVPLDFATHDGRQMHTTLSHELGHTLSLPDLYDFPEYSNDISGRLTTNWDMMAGSRDALPHYTISNKMRMDWIPSAHLKLFDFLGSGAITETVTLHAAELGDPPAGRFKAIEIRLGDGWNYYVEYRAEQAAMVTDDLPVDRRVVITDVTSDSFAPPVSRPPIVFVRNDIDGDGPLLGTGSDMEEKDPGTQMDLVIEVISTAADNAEVRVKYGSNGKPEPGIRPWSGGSDWQSPDIEVRNDRATADPSKFFNVPWLGHDNTIVAKVRNSGDLLAKGVVVDFFVTEYSSGDGPWFNLGLDTKDIAASTTVEFSAAWNPSAAQGKHYCVIVRIRLYQDPGNLAVVDQNIYNNEARSNYTKFVSASASPSSRVGATVLLANPYRESTHVYAAVKQTHSQHRVFIDHQWLRVPGKEARPIQVWDEALWGTPEWWATGGDDREKRQPRKLWETPNRVSVAGWAVRPFEADCGAMTLTGGVGMRVDAGRQTQIELRAVRRTYITGRVTYADNGGPVVDGVVLIEMSTGGGKYFTVPANVAGDGTFGRDFSNPLGDKTKEARAHFLGAFGAAPSSVGPRVVS